MEDDNFRYGKRKLSSFLFKLKYAILAIIKIIIYTYKDYIVNAKMC